MDRCRHRRPQVDRLRRPLLRHPAGLHRSRSGVAGTRLGLGIETAVVVTVLVLPFCSSRPGAVCKLWRTAVFGARPSKYEAVPNSE